MAKQQKTAKPTITIIPGRGVAQTINYLLKDRDELEWLVAVGRNKDGEIFFYDTGGGQCLAATAMAWRHCSRCGSGRSHSRAECARRSRCGVRIVVLP